MFMSAKAEELRAEYTLVPTEQVDGMQPAALVKALSKLERTAAAGALALRL